MGLRFEFDTDQDTERLLEIVAHFLQEYFGYGEEQAFGLINAYYKSRKAWADESGWGDNFYHYEGAWGSATMMRYWSITNGEGKNLREWERNEGLQVAPATASEYFRTHYFQRQQPF